MLSEQRFKKKEKPIKAFLFSAVRALACEGFRKEPHITAQALQHNLNYSASLRSGSEFHRSFEQVAVDRERKLSAHRFCEG